jgi:hypothetical protein
MQLTDPTGAGLTRTYDGAWIMQDRFSQGSRKTKSSQETTEEERAGR